MRSKENKFGAKWLLNENSHDNKKSGVLCTMEPAIMTTHYKISSMKRNFETSERKVLDRKFLG